MELERVRLANPKKVLVAAEVVEAAKDPQSALHEHFTWDDTEAAKKHRENEARNLIRAYIVHEPRVNRKVRGYISVPTDRLDGGGYRPVSDVLDRPDWVSQLVEEVRNKLLSTRTSYAHLKALDPLWDAIEKQITEFLTQRQTSAA